MATFGQTGNGGSSSTSSADADLINRSTEANSVALSSGTLDSVRARLWLSGAGSTHAKGVMYDSSGNLLATGDEITITNTTEQELTLPFSGVSQIPIVSGTSYAYGVIWDDPGTISMTWSRQSVASTSLKNGITYPTPENPLGSGTVSGPVDMYVSYTEGGSPQTINATALASTAAIGSPSVTESDITVTGITSGATMGSPIVSPGPVSISPTGKASTLTVGSPTVTSVYTISPTGVALTTSFGSPLLTRLYIISSNAITSTALFGTPTVIPAAVTISPTSINSVLAIGTVALTTTTTIIPSGIASALSFGASRAFAAPQFMSIGIVIGTVGQGTTLTDDENTAALNSSDNEDTITTVTNDADLEGEDDSATLNTPTTNIQL